MEVPIVAISHLRGLKRLWNGVQLHVEGFPTKVMAVLSYEIMLCTMKTYHYMKSQEKPGFFFSVLGSDKM